jgi:hypothetical protein
MFVDKYGREIEEFDVIKVFHFIGARRKKHYMYKIAIKYNGDLYGSHLNSNPLIPNYSLKGAEIDNMEIVQSNNWKKLEKKTKVLNKKAD